MKTKVVMDANEHRGIINNPNKAVLIQFCLLIKMPLSLSDVQ